MRVKVDNDQMRKVFAGFANSPAFRESAELFAKGKPPVEMLQAMSLRPPVLAAFGATSEGIYPGGIVERRIKELIILESSRTNSCQFCTNSHISMGHALGIVDDAGDPLGLLDKPHLMTERERLAVEYTRAAQKDSNRVPNELFDRLRTVYSDSEIVELTAMIGLIAMLNIFNNCLQVTYHGDYEAAGVKSR